MHGQIRGRGPQIRRNATAPFMPTKGGQSMEQFWDSLSDHDLVMLWLSMFLSLDDLPVLAWGVLLDAPHYYVIGLIPPFLSLCLRGGGAIVTPHLVMILYVGTVLFLAFTGAYWGQNWWTPSFETLKTHAAGDLLWGFIVALPTLYLTSFAGFLAFGTHKRISFAVSWTAITLTVMPFWLGTLIVFACYLKESCI